MCSGNVVFGIKADDGHGEALSGCVSWAAATSTPLQHGNRFDVLRSIDDDNHSDANDQDQQFTVAQLRRGKRRNRCLTLVLNNNNNRDPSHNVSSSSS